SQRGTRGRAATGEPGAVWSARLQRRPGSVSLRFRGVDSFQAGVRPLQSGIGPSFALASPTPSVHRWQPPSPSHRLTAVAAIGEAWGRATRVPGEGATADGRSETVVGRLPDGVGEGGNSAVVVLKRSRASSVRTPLNNSLRRHRLHPTRTFPR